MKVFHHNDLDGKCAAFLVGHYERIYDPRCDTALELDGGIEFVEMDYDLAFPFDRVEPDECVFIVDFSLEPSDMEALLKITSDVHWVDHHGTALAKYKGQEMAEIKGLRRVGEAGCVLTYKYCAGLFCGTYGFHAADIPWFVKLIGDRDTWSWKYGERTKFFCRGMRTVYTSPASEIWYDAWASTEPFEAKGAIVEAALVQEARDVIAKLGFWVEFEGHRCFVYGSRVMGSEYLEIAAPDAKVWICFWYSNAQWNVRLYSMEIDVSEIATRYVHLGRRGGGHPLEPGKGSAAGFQCAYPPFLPVIQSGVATYEDLRKILG